MASDGSDQTPASPRRHLRVRHIASLAHAVQRQQTAEQVSLAASGAAFWLVIAAFPMGAAIVNVFGLVVSPSEVAHDLGGIAQAAPASLGALITEQLRRAAETDRAGLSIGLAISIVLAVWSASAGVYNLDRAIRQSFGLAPQRYADARARSLVGAIVAIVVPGALAVGGATVRRHLPTVVVALVGVPVALVVLTLGIAAMYRLSVGPAARARKLLPGSLAAAMAVIASLAAFAAYLSLSTRYTAVYGAFAGLVIGMISSYLAVYAILLGAVLSAQLHQAGASTP